MVASDQLLIVNTYGGVNWSTDHCVCIFIRKILLLLFFSGGRDLLPLWVLVIWLKHMRYGGHLN